MPERLDAFAVGYRQRFGARLRPGRRNRNPVPEAERWSAVSDRVRRRVEELCAPDLRVYEAVVGGRLSAR